MELKIRLAKDEEVAELNDLIAASARVLSKGFYDDDQTELAIKNIFRVDPRLVEDGSYYVAEVDGAIAGCGGWSRRNMLVNGIGNDSEFLDPATDPAKIRAFFVHPDFARRGVGRSLVARCESDAAAFGFRSLEMMSTLPGVPLYQACGYEPIGNHLVPVGEGVEIECIIMRKAIV